MATPSQVLPGGEASAAPGERSRGRGASPAGAKPGRGERPSGALSRARPLLAFLACLGGGALVGLSTPPWGVLPLVWVGLAVLEYLLREDTPLASRPRPLVAGALRGLVFGAGTNLVALRFVVPVVTRFTPLPGWVGILALVLLSLEQGLRFSVAAVLTIQLARRGVPRWLAFGVGVYLGSLVPCVFPWTVATPVATFPPLVQLAEFIGERGVAALIALSSGLAAEGLCALFGPAASRSRAGALLAAAAAIPALTYAEGLVAMQSVERERLAAPKARVALLQPSIEATERWDPGEAGRILERLTELTRSAESGYPPPDLTVWTEGAYPYLVDARARSDVLGRRAIRQPGIRGPLFVGLMMRGPQGAYNAATIVSDGRLSEPYFKSHLLIFGEYVPFGETFPWLNEVFYRGTGLVRGRRQVLLEAGRIRAVALNCYEDTLSHAVREAMTVDPNLLVNITNDAWYTETMESELHLELATTRSVEVRRDMVRAVNYGETTWVDAAGTIRARYSSGVPGVLITEPALLSGRTLYTRAGDIPMVVISILAVLPFLWRWRKAGAPGSKGEGRERSKNGA